MFQKEVLLIQIVHINSVGNVCYSKRIKKKSNMIFYLRKTFDGALKQMNARDIDKSILIFYFKSNV